MKNILFFTGILLISSLFTLTSCEKSGCTDPNACNYDGDAKDDDGSCRYNRDVWTFTQKVNLNEFATSNPVAEFSFSQYTVESCYADDITEVRLMVENTTTDTISIECEVVMQEDAFTQYWSYDYVVSHLAPGAIDTVGMISTDPTPIEGKEFDFPGIYTVTIH